MFKAFSVYSLIVIEYSSKSHPLFVQLICYVSFTVLFQQLMFFRPLLVILRVVFYLRYRFPFLLQMKHVKISLILSCHIVTIALSSSHCRYIQATSRRCGKACLIASFRDSKVACRILLMRYNIRCLIAPLNLCPDL